MAVTSRDEGKGSRGSSENNGFDVNNERGEDLDRVEACCVITRSTAFTWGRQRGCPGFVQEASRAYRCPRSLR